jgi:hypothetical protein
VLAGTATAVGVFAASTTFGPLVLLAGYAALSLFAITTVWGLSHELGIEPSSAVQWGFSAALAVIVAAGLSLVHPQWGLLVVVLLGVSSPTALTLLAKVRPAATRRRKQPAARPGPGVLIDRALLDSHFDAIVSQLRESGDFPES